MGTSVLGCGSTRRGSDYSLKHDMPIDFGYTLSTDDSAVFRIVYQGMTNQYRGLAVLLNTVGTELCRIYARLSCEL